MIKPAAYFLIRSWNVNQATHLYVDVVGLRILLGGGGGRGRGRGASAKLGSISRSDFRNYAGECRAIWLTPRHPLLLLAISTVRMVRG